MFQDYDDLKENFEHTCKQNKDRLKLSLHLQSVVDKVP
jgi:hypothetical protein